MDEQQILIGLTVIVVLAVAGQSLGQRLGIPAILVLLVLGMVAGPFTGLLDPDAILGDLLFPLVSLSVGLILFEGGLLLRFKDLTTEASSVVRRLLSLGVLVTWLGAAAAGVVVLGLSPSVSAVLGALLTVSGPTVVLPLLSYIRPSGNVEAVLRWEGIFVDAIGASLAVLVFDAVLAGGSISPPLQISISVLVTGGICRFARDGTVPPRLFHGHAVGCHPCLGARRVHRCRSAARRVRAVCRHVDGRGVGQPNLCSNRADR